MKIGVISDTHDHIENTKIAVKKFNEEKVAYIFHAGDIISPFVAPLAFKELKGKLFAVYGNNDGEILFLKEKFAEIEAEITTNQFSIDLEGKKIALFHTLESQILDAVIQSNKFAVVIYGHTHKAEIKKINNTLVINPGEACGYLTGKATAGIVDLDKLEAKLIFL
ncbi:MAG: metallophosphoesterase [Candidatus Helarchaeota archaeon]|nr:metallophosphoesterase [Candidatus Helarchaeota archaeon]